MKRAFVLILLPSVLLAQDCRVSTILTKIRPGAQWSMDNQDFSTVKWLDALQTKPTQGEVDTAISNCLSQSSVQEAAVNRAKFTINLSTSTQAQKIAAIITILNTLIK